MKYDDQVRGGYVVSNRSAYDLGSATIKDYHQVVRCVNVAVNRSP